MEYVVIGADGLEYGPVNLDTLKQWAADNRVGPDSNLKEFQTGKVIAARTVPELFPSVASFQVPPSQGPPPPGQPLPGEAYSSGPYSQPPTYYPRGGSAAQVKTTPKNSDIYWAIGRSVMALLLFFAFNGIGLIVGLYGVIYAFRAYQAGHKLGLAALVISIATMVIIGIGWVFRLSGPKLG